MMRVQWRNVRGVLAGVTLAVTGAVVAGWSAPLLAQAPTPAKGVKFAQVTAAELTEYLTYLSSDQLAGRQIYTEGYGLAAGYIQAHLRQWGVKPLGENGT